MRLREILKWTSFRWGLVVAIFVASGAAFVFVLDYRLATAGVTWAINRSVLEQLELLSERPPELLPFMISSRLQHQPQVLTKVALFDSSGRLIVGDIRQLPKKLILDRKVHLLNLGEGVLDQRRFAHAAGARLSNGRILVVARNANNMTDLRENFLLALLAGVAPAMAISIAAGILIGLRTQRRLHVMRDEAEAIIEGDLHKRLPVSGSGDGLDQLATTVNQILSHMEELVGALKGVGEDIAHDLRTPLTWIHSRLERANDTMDEKHPARAIVAQTITGIDQTLQTISSLLRIAEIEQLRRRSHFTVCDLALIARETAENYAPVAEDKGITIDVAASPALIDGDFDLLIEAVVNVLENAVKFTPPGGGIDICACVEGGRSLLRISDNGPGISLSERKAVLRRFYRGDKSRGTAGNGLGLSLVAAVASMHDADLLIDDNDPGCVVQLSFPTAKRPVEQGKPKPLMTESS